MALAVNVPEVLRRDGDEIVRDWEARVRQSPRARGLDRPRLRDDVPPLIDGLASYVEAGGGGKLLGDLPEAHGEQRLSLGYDLAEVVWEYSELRDTILGRLGDDD